MQPPPIGPCLENSDNLVSCFVFSLLLISQMTRGLKSDGIMIHLLHSNYCATAVCVFLGTVERGKAQGRCLEPESVEPQSSMGTGVSTVELTERSVSFK